MRVPRIHAADLRVAMVSMHTSPLDQPGTGDAGGLNVYVAQTARRLAEAGVAVDVFTRANSEELPDVVPMWPGVNVVNLGAGPRSGLSKEDLPGQVCPFTAELMRVAGVLPAGHYDLVHSHYWLSGQAGWLASDRWSVPLVHTMHTLAKVKNDHLADSDSPEPLSRVVGEEQLVEAADRLIANTGDERDDLVDHYDADPDKVHVVHPGVDLETFSPAPRAAARRRAGLPLDKHIALFVGRIQPLKAPDLLLRAAAELIAAEPDRRDRLRVVVCGGPSGAGLARPDELHKLAAELGITDIVTFLPPVTPDELADLYRSADLVTVPSFSESFGLVALEAQACGTPVLAADVGGLRTAVADGTSGLLLPDHRPGTWAAAMRRVLTDRALARRLGAGAVAHARAFSWSATAAGMLAVYEQALSRPSVTGLRAVN